MDDYLWWVSYWIGYSFFIKSIIIIEIIIAIIQNCYQEILFMIRNKCGNLIESFLYYKYIIENT